MAQETQSFVIKYQDFVDEITSKCTVYHATTGVFNAAEPVSFGEFKALWDTGATNSMITSDVIKTLNLKIVTYATVYHAGGQSQVPGFNVYIGLPNDILIGPLQVIEGQLEGVDVLIGMDIIGSGDFTVTNNDGHTEFSYTIPSVMKI